MEYDLIQLPNGIRVIQHHSTSPVSHACMIINAGARDEQEGHYGLAHFIEHLLFKQTEKRNTTQILNRLEAVGGDLNAYTTKEYTCVHASFLTPYLARALDLFEDLFFHSVFPESEMEKEKGVILDEMASYWDSPEEAIMDDFEDLLFQGHALGHNILGTVDDLKRLTKADIVNFIQRNYNTHEIVIGVTGDYSLKEVRGIANRILGKIPESRNRRYRQAPTQYGNHHAVIKKPINQAHYVMGGLAYDIHHEYKTGLLLLNNILGGMGMSSRLNLVVRERHGIAYTIESNYTPLSDTGLFHIYFGTDEEKADKARRLVGQQLKKMREQKLGVMQLYQAKKKFKGQIALGEENRLNLIITLAKSLLDYGSVQTLDEVFAKIDAVTADQLLAIANEIFADDHLSSLSFVPE
ncbi:insulinase family protein [Parapedobacter sp. ISTM3]|uniref:M16 family metallopeptidase n=1 Tax=Parapedobacter sp. ISTM3 TaxID=2800130 RepID=UPI00190854B0|nr:pitrilysin family protein [Parapedobacter sp. ISTM3]MBK1441131.1 insulinase family protein [Parapedobacter sp. ISTM3]